MFSRNLRFYRLQKNLSKKDLAGHIGVSPQAITNYEKGSRMPGMEIIRKIADFFHVRVIDFLAIRDENLSFNHGDFRKLTRMSESRQEYVRESVEEYCSRFFSIVEILGGDVLPESPTCHSLVLGNSPEEDAKLLREHLRLAPEGPISNIIEILENKGIIFYSHQEGPDFSGMSGDVNGRPYIVFNNNMSAERIRSTIVHELAHIMFLWGDVQGKEQEDRATAISGAFLFPAEDVIRELGVKRNGISNDMKDVCIEYGISMYMLAKRAVLCNVINKSAEKYFYMRASKLGWNNHEPERIPKENPKLFSQLVYRSVSEGEISPGKGAELLKISVDSVMKACNFSVTE